MNIRSEAQLRSWLHFYTVGTIYRLYSLIENPVITANEQAVIQKALTACEEALCIMKGHNG